MEFGSSDFFMLMCLAAVVMGGIYYMIYWTLYQTQHWYGSEEGYFPINSSEYQSDLHQIVLDVDEKIEEKDPFDSKSSSDYE